MSEAPHSTEVSEAMEVADQDGVSVEVVKAEIENDSLEGNVPADVEVATLHRYIRAKNRINAERDRVKEQVKIIMDSLERKERNLDYVFGTFASDVTSRLISVTKAKSHKTPWGTAGFRKVNANVIVEDKEALIQAVIAEHGRDPTSGLAQALVMKPDIVKAKLNEYVLGTGDLVAGVSVTPEHDKFYVK